MCCSNSSDATCHGEARRIKLCKRQVPLFVQTTTQLLNVCISCAAAAAARLTLG